jgi:UDP-3-O-[3-hydroxymyristoyl] N-acetylglucosamine deacetylase
MDSLQKTIISPIKCYGIGVHSGAEVSVSILPAAEGTGIVFKRVDLSENNIIEASYMNVADTRLCTVIANNFGVQVSTIEHIMSAIWACDIDNAIIEIDGPEMAIMDGSAAPFVALIEKAGIKTQRSPRKYIRIEQIIRVEEGDKFIELQPSDGFIVDYAIEFPHPVIGKQSFVYEKSINSYHFEVSRARTFGFNKEFEQLKQMGLARGGSLANAIGIDDNGVMNPEGLRYPDEFVKHKVLDCIGDLFLAGYRIQGRVLASKAGHALHNQVLRKLFSQKEAFSIFEMPLNLPKTNQQ